jgi:hypothetical protein
MYSPLLSDLREVRRQRPCFPFSLGLLESHSQSRPAVKQRTKAGDWRPRASKSAKLQRTARATVCNHSAKDMATRFFEQEYKLWDFGMILASHELLLPPQTPARKKDKG